MYQRAGSKEQERLEHGVGKEMEHAGHVAQTAVMHIRHCIGAGHAERHHHERNLRNGGECEHALDVNLRAGHYCSIEGCDGTYDGNEIHRRIDHTVDREHTGHQIDTGHNHCGRMDKGRHRCRTFHCIGKPDVERKHRRLTHTAGEDEHHGPCQHGAAEECGAACLGEHVHRVGSHIDEVECLCEIRERQNTEQEAKVGESGDDKRLLRSRHRRGKTVEEPD